MRPAVSRAALAVGLTVIVMSYARDGVACGGCFVPRATTETSVVTGHRMAFAISTSRTVLWDQIQYSGDPAEFSWVLPVRGAATLEAAEDAWFDVLDAVTSTRVSPPQLNCLIQSSGSSGCDGCGASESATSGRAAPTAFDPNSGVVVTHQGTVGPYAYVQLRASSTESLTQWLPANGYAIPDSAAAVIAAYVADQFDFIALKLRPGIGTRQMTPVRVITQGASPTLPLRMVAAGTGAFVGISLYVISESRFEAVGYNNTTIDPSNLTFDWSANRSNYADLRTAALASAGGNTWLTTFAARGAFSRSWSDALGQPIVFSLQSGQLGNAASLASLYFAGAASNARSSVVCAPFSELESDNRVVDTCVTSAAADAAPAESLEGGSLEGGSSDGASDRAPDAARAPEGGGVLPVGQHTCTAAPSGQIAASSLECGSLTDLSAALIGMHPADVWITRLDANLPRAALDSRSHGASGRFADRNQQCPAREQTREPPLRALGGPPARGLTAGAIAWEEPGGPCQLQLFVGARPLLRPTHRPQNALRRSITALRNSR